MVEKKNVTIQADGVTMRWTNAVEIETGLLPHDKDNVQAETCVNLNRKMITRCHVV